jgi:putative peptide zinc metalloprotease protein
MVTFHDPLTEELQRSHLRLNDELIFSPQKYGDDVFVHVEVPSASRFFRIGFAEYVFISQLDGTTSSASALAVTAQSQGPDALNEDKAREVIDWLLQNGLAGFEGNYSGIDANEKQAAQNNWLTKLNPFWIKLPLGNPNRLLDGALPCCRWMFHPLTILLSMMFMVAGLMAALTNWEALFGGFNLFASSNWIWLLASWVLLKMVHEFAHAITCRRFGGQVPEAGLIFILLAPLAYVNVTSSWRFQNKWKRIAVAVAGMYVELFVAALCVFAMLGTESAVVRDVLVNTIVMSGITTLLFNANPLMRFDGYFILSDLLEIPNLYENGSKAFRKDASWIFLGQSNESSCREIKNRRKLTSTYGWFASIWKVLICVGMTITASTMFGGLGILLALFGVISWFGKPAFEMGKRLSIHFKRRPQAMVRTGVLTSLATLFLVASWLWIPSPFAVHAPCVVDFQDAAKVRTESAGFVAELFVKEGTAVSAGQPLLRIRNAELTADVKKLQARLQLEQTRERIALDESKPADAQVALRQQESIWKSLRARMSEQDALVVKAPCAGQVVARDLEAMAGKYFEKGEILMLICDDSVKELVVSLPANEFHQAKQLLGCQIPIEVNSRRRFYATVSQVAPRATTQVSHPSLIDPNGGSIPVQQSEETSLVDEQSPDFEYCEPRLNLIAKLDGPIGKSVWAGERGHAVLANSNTTLGKWIFITTRDWLRKQIEFAQPVANR